MYSPERCYKIAYGAFIDISNLNGEATEQEKKEAEEAILDFIENVPGFREQVPKAYKDIMVEIKERGSNKSLDDLRQFGIKLGLEQEQQISNDVTGNGKSSCCHLL